MGEDFAKSPDKETAAHSAQLKQLASKIKEQHPGLKVELLLMALDGKVETIPA